MRACAIVLRSTAMCSLPGRTMLSVQFVLPVTSRASSLRRTALLEGPLHLVPLAGRETVDRRHLGAVCLNSQHAAALRGLPVQLHGARPAVAGVAADRRTHLAKVLPQVVHEQKSWLHVV